MFNGEYFKKNGLKKDKKLLKSIIFNLPIAWDMSHVVMFLNYLYWSEKLRFKFLTPKTYCSSHRDPKTSKNALKIFIDHLPTLK
jgi:hypothetical protein